MAPYTRLSISLLCSSTDPSVSLSEVFVSFFVTMTNLMTAFTVNKDGLQFSFRPSRVLPLRSFQLFHPPSIYEKTSHRAPILGRSNLRLASQIGHSSSKCRVLSSFYPNSYWSESASFRRYKYFPSRLWSVQIWISMADSWVDKPLYSLIVYLFGRAPSNFHGKTPTV